MKLIVVVHEWVDTEIAAFTGESTLQLVLLLHVHMHGQACELCQAQLLLAQCYIGLILHGPFDTMFCLAYLPSHQRLPTTGVEMSIWMWTRHSTRHLAMASSTKAA